MRKIIELDEHFPKTGELTVQPVPSWGSGRHHDTSRVTKYASAALDYIKAVAPEPGKTLLLLNALGAEETYGPNRNGDGFPEFPVPARGKTASADRRWFVPPGEELTSHFDSFERNPAHAFQHHVNRDPAKASGVVKKAFWNPRMHRVELLVSVDNDKDPEWIKRANDGEFVPVSMGCFLAGAPVALADGTEKPIEQIVVGDLVRTHTGRVQPVTEVHQRAYRGNVYTVRAEAHPAFHATEEHPFFVTPRESVREPARKGAKARWRTDAKVEGAWTHASCLDDQFLLEPIDRTVVDAPYATRAFARLFGYYLAKGHIIWRDNKPYAIELTTHQDDSVHAEIAALCTAFGTKNEPWTFERKNYAVARGIMICDEQLATLCYTHGGTHAKQKRLSMAAMQWPPALQREMFGAYANGDGCGRDGWLKVSTASSTLAAQWLRLLPRLGVLASGSTLNHAAGGGFNVTATIEHVVHIGIQWAWRLRDVCAKVTVREVLARKESRKIIGDYVVTPIRDITQTYQEVAVYNLEVAEDNSYLVEGLATHNCRIKRDVCARCGNEAPTRAAYCDHVKYAMNVVDANGFKDYVHNPSPDFFDISRVFRPADRTGYTLKKVADVADIRLSADLGAEIDRLAIKGAAAQKLSDINKVIRAEPLASSTLTPDAQAFIVKFRDHAAPKLARAQDIDVAPLFGHSLGTTLRTAAEVGFVFNDAEFIRLASTKLAGHSVPLAPAQHAKIAAAARWTLATFGEHPQLLEALLATGTLEATKQASTLVPFFTDACEKRAYVGEMLYRRLVPEGTGFRPDAAATTDLLQIGDNQTTRGAAIAAQDAVTRSHIGKVVGGTALLLGGYKALTAFPWLRQHKLPLGLGAAALGSTLRHRPGTTTYSDEGYEIPTSTETVGKYASEASLVHLIECALRTQKCAALPTLQVTGDTELDGLAMALGTFILG